jgi:hypothetical protein
MPNSIECCRLVVKDGCHLLRPRKNEPLQYDAKHFCTGGNKRGWFYLDSWTASAILGVFDHLSETNQAKYLRFPIYKMAEIAFKLLNKGTA